MNQRFLLIFLILVSHIAASQEALEPLEMSMDSLIQDPNSLIQSFESKSLLDPDRAALYSAVLPGMGQAYNKQYWKIPIIYAGGILIGHYIKYNNDIYNAFRNAYIAQTDNDDRTENPFRFGEAALRRNAEKFRRDRDFLIIVGVAYYILNIVDAHVAAHLSEFDINSDLSLVPSYQQGDRFTSRNIGLSLVFNLSK